ncbi:hypothetical protein D3C74_404450 [compost metagenome]
MGPFDPADPQQTHQDNHIAKRIPQVILADNHRKRQQRHQAERHNVAPKEELSFIFTGQQRGQCQNQHQLEQFGRLKAEGPHTEPALCPELHRPEETYKHQNP